MKNLLIVAISILTLSACSSKKNGISEEETLPKDIALKAAKNFTQEIEQEELSTLIKEIEATIAKETCSDPTDWKFTAIGSKPCGGPSSYIAYPIEIEDEILKKVSSFTSKQSSFNLKYGLMSDCAMVLPPAEIRCENGKAILIANDINIERID